MGDFLSKLLAGAGVQAPAQQPVDDQSKIRAWLERKAQSYPPNTPPERAAQWQEHDRKRYEEIMRQMRAAEAQAQAPTSVLAGMLGGGVGQR